RLLSETPNPSALLTNAARADRLHTKQVLGSPDGAPVKPCLLSLPFDFFLAFLTRRQNLEQELLCLLDSASAFLPARQRRHGLVSADRDRSILPFEVRRPNHRPVVRPRQCYVGNTVGEAIAWLAEIRLRRNEQALAWVIPISRHYKSSSSVIDKGNAADHAAIGASARCL